MRVAKIEGYAEQLRTHDQMAQSMRSVLYQPDALDLETIEPETVLRDGAIVDVRVNRANRSKQLIEDL